MTNGRLEGVNLTESDVEQSCVNGGALLCYQGLTDRRVTIGARHGWQAVGRELTSYRNAKGQVEPGPSPIMPEGWAFGLSSLRSSVRTPVSHRFPSIRA